MATRKTSPNQSNKEKPTAEERAARAEERVAKSQQKMARKMTDLSLQAAAMHIGDARRCFKAGDLEHASAALQQVKTALGNVRLI